VAVICGNLNPPTLHGSCPGRRAPRQPVFVSGLHRGPIPELGPVACRSRVEREITIRLAGRIQMFDFQDLFQWDRFITPHDHQDVSYWLVIGLLVLDSASPVFCSPF